MIETVKAWQCLGCGRIDAPQPCIGVCEDRKVELVYAAEHARTLADLARERGRAQRLGALLRLIAATTPRAGEWERSYLALQAQARAILADLAADASPRVD